MFTNIAILMKYTYTPILIYYCYSVTANCNQISVTKVLTSAPLKSYFLNKISNVYMLYLLNSNPFKDT